MIFLSKYFNYSLPESTEISSFSDQIGENEFILEASELEKFVKKFNLNYGYNFIGGEFVRAKEQAFTVKKSVLKHKTSVLHNEVTHSKNSNLNTTKSLVFGLGGNFENFAKFGIKYETAKSGESYTEDSLKLIYRETSIAEIEISDYEMSSKFKNALDDFITSKDCDKLEEIMDNFGRIMPMKVRLGSGEYFKSKISKDKNSIDTTKGIDVNLFAGTNGVGLETNYQDRISSKYGNEKNKQVEFFESYGGNDFKSCEPCGYGDIKGIFELLNDGYQEMLVEARGTVILYTNIGQEIKFSRNDYEVCFEMAKIPKEKIKSSFSKLNLKDFKVFPTLININDENNFTIRLNRSAPDKNPMLIIHRIYGVREQCGLKVGLIVVGYCRSIEHLINSLDKIKLETSRVEIVQEISQPVHRSLYDVKGFPVGIPETCDSNIKTNLVVGHHFYKSNNDGNFNMHVFGCSLKASESCRLPERININTFYVPAASCDDQDLE
ncbi:7879_t:CDS:1, partial [Cetraspora pellucida]